jgi:AraC-like DNA-binding protein
MFTIKDSLDNQWQISNAMNIQTQAKVKDIEEEKKILEFEKELSYLKINAQQKSIVLSVLLFTITLIGGVVIFLQKQNLEKAYEFLVQKNRLLTSITQKNQVQVREVKLEKTIKQEIKQQQETELLKKLEIELSEKIETALEDEKIFLDNTLTLISFAQHLNTNTTYLSKIINNIYNKRFSILINEYRVKEILIYFETNQLKELTIFALAQKAGFSSKSAFNSAFKDYTGVTPSFYLKQANKDKT